MWTDALRKLGPDEIIYIRWDYFRNAYGRDAGLRIDHLLLVRTVVLLLRRPAEREGFGIDRKLVAGGQRPLDRIFQLAESLLGVRKRVEPRSSRDRVLNIGLPQVEVVAFSNANGALYRAPLSILVFRELFSFGEFPERGDVHGKRPFALGNRIGLSFEEGGCGLLPARLGFGDGSLISIEQRNDG